MSLQWDEKRYSNEADEDDFDINDVNKLEDELSSSKGKPDKKWVIRKKLEERLDQKKLRSELDDYEEEIHKEFDWDDGKES